jgi:hypothetical protein
VVGAFENDLGIKTFKEIAKNKRYTDEEFNI